MNTKPDTKRTVFIAAFLTLGLVLPLALYSGAAPNQDEAYYVLVSGDFAAGKGIPYSDYASDPKPPGIYYALAPLFALTGASVFAGRILVFAVNMLAAVFAYKIGEKISKGSGRAAALIYLAATLVTAYEGFSILTEPFMALFLAAAAYAALIAKGSRGFLLAGVLGGVSFLFKQPGALFVIFLLAYIGLEVWNKKMKAKGAAVNFVAGAAGFVIPAALAILHFASMGALDDLIKWTFVVPSQLRGNFGFLSVAGAYHMAALGVVWILALGYIIKLKRKDGAGISLATLGVLSLVPWLAIQFGHYLVPSVFVAAVLGAAFVHENKAGITKVSMLAIIVAVLFVGTLALDVYAGNNFQRNSAARNEGLAEVSDYIKANTAAGDNIFVFGYDPAIYLLSEKRPPFRSYHVLEHLLGNSEDEIERGLNKVSLVVKVTDCTINENVCKIIESNYASETNLGSYEILRRTNSSAFQASLRANE